MESKMKRFLMLLISLVLLTSVLGTVAFAEEPDNQAMPECYRIGDVDGDGDVDVNDAIRTLQHSLFDSLYPVSHDQSCDFDGNGIVDTMDAIYVLKATFEGFYEDDEGNPIVLKETVHDYYDPAWEWTELKNDVGEVTGYKASVTFKCGCDDGKNVENGTHTHEAVVTSEQTKDPTCVAKGTLTYTAVYGEYKATKNVDIPATANGHAMNGTPSCTQGAKCNNDGCIYEQPALGHQWKKVGSTDATCQVAATETYHCERNCGIADKLVTLELTDAAKANLHHYVYDHEEHTEGTCSYTKVLKCADCSVTKNGDTYYVHTFKAELTTPATCSATGVKTYTCTVCNDASVSYTEEVPVNEDHTWVEGDTANGVTTHNCSVCRATKTTVAVSNEETVSKEAVAGNQIELENGATMELDSNVVESLDAEKEIKINVTAVPKSELTNVDADELAQIAGANVYDFTLEYSDGTDVAADGYFDGYITISLPYELQEGDDVDNINVWYIADDGSLQSFKGVYNNGFVTFQTNHFSYYTVTRLTNAQRCALYDHAWNEVKLAATCTGEGRHVISCQRCGEVDKDERVAPLGHNYQPTGNGTAATCETEGTTEEKCQNCGDIKTGTLPALGHDYVVSTEKSQAATHTAAGKTVSVCSHCGQESTEELSQLAHSWETDSQAATCTTGGYEKKVCAGCGSEELISQTAPLGHSYTKADWVWATDYSEVTATLTCDFANCGHTLELQGAVERFANSATCTSGGSIRYVGSVSYNGKTFSNETEPVKTNPAAHKPGTELHSNLKQHYYLCTDCETKIAVEDHTWGNETVVSAATCVKNGKATIECTVCGYDSEKVLPATGVHTYVDGVCSCGQRENECTHVRMYTTTIDISAYDICDGAVIKLDTCDCGEIKRVYFENVNCDFVTTSSPMDDMGNGITTNTCIDCGLQVIYETVVEIDVENCVRDAINHTTILFDDEVITESISPSGLYMEHPFSVIVENIDLSQYGLCKSGITKMGCYCGKYGMFWDMTGGGCRFEYDESRSTEDITYYVCSVCGGEMTVEYRIEEDGCTINYYDRHTFYVDGVEVYALDGGSYETLHNFVVASYELYGDSCEDGILVTTVCEKCSESHEFYTTSHTGVEVETTDLTGYDFCAVSMTTETCPCEEQVKNTYFIFGENGSHSMWYRGQEVSEDGLVVTTYYQCELCGYMITTVTTYSNPDEHCMCDVDQVTTYTNGIHTITGYAHYTEWEYHDLEISYSLLGETCKDGILVTEACTRCDYVYSYEQSTGYHWSVIKAVYDVSHLDMCTTEIRLMECVCGEEAYFNFYDDHNNCWWNWVEGGPSYYIEQCPDCQTQRKTEYEDIEQIDPCHVKRHYTYTLTRDGKEPFVFEVDRVDDIHERVFNYTLLNPEMGCDGGYDIVATCFHCGDVDDSWGTGYGHESRTVAITKLTNGELCGDIYREDVSCACGYNSWSYTTWSGGSCNYESGYESKEDGAWVDVCSTCGGERLGFRTEEKVEGATCAYKSIEHEIYRKNGVTVADNVRENTYTSHRNSIATPVLLNPEQGCDGGYTLNFNCPECGESWQDVEVYYGCETYRVESTLLFENDAICGPIYQNVYRCACGKEIGLARNEDCSFSWYWDDKLDAEVGECWECGLKIATRHEFTPIEGETCKRTTDITYQFMLGDNDPVVVEVSGIESSHETITTFMDADEDPNNNLCETGYYVAFQCVSCDYYSSDTNWVRMGHERYPVEYHDLVKEFGACAGHIRKTSCACGENTYWDWDMSTFWNKAEYMGTDPETGLNIHQCPDCDLQYIDGRKFEEDPETCTGVEIEYNRLARNGETLLVFDRVWTYEAHDWLGLSSSLKNPDGDCYDGFIWDIQCRNCGVIGQAEGYGHSNYATQILELPENTCGGRIIEGRCACGQNTFVSHEYNCDEDNFTTESWYEIIDGVGHYFWKYTCNNCKLTHVSDRYDENIDDCHVRARITYTYSLGEEELGVYTQSFISESHDWEFTYTLMEGSVTCDDGVYRTGSCKNCGQYLSDEIYGHESGTLQRIDLSQYGAEGDTCLIERSCACGWDKDFYTEGSETSCDLCFYDTEPWIEDYLNDVGPLYSTNGTGYWIHSYFYDVRCAVTDPQCSFRMRNAEYWKQEGCAAVEYEIWEVYDPATESFVTLSHEPTGDRLQNHNYTETITENVTEENGDYITYKRELVCPDCGSTYVLREGVRANGAQFTQWDIVNTLNNGDFKEHHFINEYGVTFNGFQYETLQKDLRVSANGYELWDQWEYTDYNFDGNCTRTEIYSNHNGNRDVRVMRECHLHGGWEYEWVKYSTCSQFGLEIGTVSCTVCDTVYDYNEWIYEPRNHEDMYWDYDKQMYVCPHCGLEFSNYASGSIAMEDLTEAYGNGENYVIGYWNQNPDQEFNPTLTVILEDVAEGENDILLLDYSAFSYLNTENGDAITAVTFNEAAADEAAAQAVADAGYSGIYSLRFNFVIIGGGELDYAITFDPVTTNNA